MLPGAVLDDVVDVIREASEGLRRRIVEGRVTQEPDMTSRVVQEIEVRSASVPGVTIEFTVIDGLGPGAAENTIGADVLGVVRIEVEGRRQSKGFLAQSKRDGQDGLHLDPAPPEDEGGAYSHWLWRGDEVRLERSGTIHITKPSARLAEQCENMLRLTPASFVFVYSPDQIAVVSATAVKAHRSAPPRTKKFKPLGTKQLDDFFVHVLDCFIGDESLSAASTEELRQLALTQRASTAWLLRVRDEQTDDEDGAGGAAR
ncbi:hypothetical protein [Nocardioides sp.]|uniref:hypothetical protein n=1 Tax=Nocardioides sp. TaxID=35761 RepID=UPI0035AFE965